MKCERCNQKMGCHWNGLCDACKLHDTLTENKIMMDALKEIKKEYDDSWNMLYFANQAINITKQTLTEVSK